MHYTVRYCSTQEEIVIVKSFTIVIDDANVFILESWVNWISEYGHGSFDESGDIICKSPVDYMACHLKAVNLKLLPKSILFSKQKCI